MDALLYAGAGAGAVIAMFTVFGMLFRVMKPWLQQQLLDPIQATHREVTVNGGRSMVPTLKDDISNLGRKVEELCNNVQILALAVTGHDVTIGSLKERHKALEAELLQRESANPAA